METGNRNVKRNRKGLVLPLVAAIALCLALLGIGLLQLGFGSRHVSAMTILGITARTAADAGMTKAQYEMNLRFIPDVGWDGTLPPDVVGELLGNSNTTFSYHVDAPLAHPVTGADYWLITSTGQLGRQKKTVYAVLGMRNRFEYALIVTDSIDLKAGTIIDGYSSIEGWPPDPDIYYPLKIGTNSIQSPQGSGGEEGIIINSGVVVKGDVLVGPGGNEAVVIDDRPEGGNTTGMRYSLPSPFIFDEIKKPESYHATGVNLSGSDLSITALPEDGFTELNPYIIETNLINISDVLNVVGHVEIHVIDTMIFGSGAELFIGELPSEDPTAPPPVPSSLIIYLDGDLEGRNAGGINNLTLIPANFILYGTGTGDQKWVIKNSREFYGVYYAPNAEIVIHNEADIFGSVSGQSFQMMNSGTLHYDVQLSDLIGADVGFGIDRWWEVSESVSE